jgi:hypothetical protein
MRAAEYVKALSGEPTPTLNHVEAFHKELRNVGLLDEAVEGPMLIPDYTPDHVKNRQWGVMKARG